MDNVAARPVARGRLALSRAPVAELAAAAIRAAEAAGLEPADVEFVVVAVPVQQAERAATFVERELAGLEVPASG